MERRQATVAMIGAGDFIGAAIARKFAAEGFTVFAGRRTAKSSHHCCKRSKQRGQGSRRPLDARQEARVPPSWGKRTRGSAGGLHL